MYRLEKLRPGMTTRAIAETFPAMDGAEVSPSLLSKVTDAVWEPVQAWQTRPLAALYPLGYREGIVVKIRQDNRVITQSVPVALGVNLDGHQAVLGLWLAETEGAKFWLSVLTERQTRGLKDIFIGCVEGLTGFPEAIQPGYPKKVQLGSVPLLRNALNYVAYQDRRAVAADLQRLYQAVTVAEAEQALERFSERWDGKYPSIRAMGLRHWEHIITLFDYPEAIRRVIYTTNAIESLNSVIRKATKNRRGFPTDRSAMKVVYLAIERAAQKGTVPAGQSHLLTIRNFRIS